MARKVKCAITGEVGTNETFVKIGSHYYKSVDVYEKSQQEKRNHAEIISRLAGYMGYQKGQQFPTLVTKSLKELSFYGNDVILKTIIECDDVINRRINAGSFHNDYSKCAYIMAIIKNSINDVYAQSQVAQKAEKAMETKQLIVEDFMMVNRAAAPKPERNIMNWLEDEEI